MTNYHFHLKNEGISKSIEMNDVKIPFSKENREIKINLIGEQNG